MSVRDRVAPRSHDAVRPRIPRAAWPLASSLLLAGCGAHPDAELVEVGATTLEVTGTQTLDFTRDLEAGSYLVTVREDGIDLRTSVTAAGGGAEVSDEIPRHGAQFAVVSLAEPGRVLVQVRNSDHSSKRGRALLRVARWKRAPQAAPGELERGYASLASAGQQSALATRDSHTLAADQLHEAITHFEKAGDDAATAQAQYTLANLQYLARNEWGAAIRAAEAAADSFDAANDEVGVQNAATLQAAAELELATGMKTSTQRAEQRALYAAADRRLRKAGDFFAAHQLKIRAEYAVNMRGLRALYVGDYEEAAELFARAAGMARDNQDLGEQARSLANLAWAHNRLGYIARAAQEYAELLPLVERDRQPFQYAQLLGNYGFCLIALGEFDRALALQTQALEIYTSVGMDIERAVALAALGGLYFRIGDTERALETLRAAIAEQERVGDSQGQASTLRVAGNAAASLGRHSDALDYLRRSAQIDGNPNSVARTRVLIAGELRALGELSAAEAELATALESKNPLVHANALEERARLRLAQRDTDAGIADLRAADREYLALGLEFNRIETNTALSQELLARQDTVGAAAAADTAVAIVSHIRVNSTNPEWRARFLSARYSPFEARIAVDLATRGDSPEAGAWRAFRTAETVRARSLADELAGRPGQAGNNEVRDDELSTRLTSLQVRLESRMQRQEIDEDEIAELRRSIEETRAKVEAQRAGVAASESQLPASLAQVRAQLPPGTAVLAYFVGDAASHGWLLSRTELRHATLPGRAELQRAIEREVAALRDGDKTPNVERPLGTTLLAHLVDGVAETRLLVLPDGPLNGVPFATLSLRGKRGALLIDQFVLGYAPSLALAMSRPTAPHGRSSKVAVVSDPVYAPDDQRLRLAGGPAGGNFRGQAPAPVSRLTRLPYSSLEARAVTRAFGEQDTIQLSGFDATAAQVLKLPASDLAVLHFATHAIARRDAPEQSALYLTGYKTDGSPLGDNRLTTGDITRSRLRADVVVLSGCATGDGSELRGEGVLGLTYGFLANGADSVVAALWPIEDASTARFMSEFYRAYRASGKASEALREAQIRTRTSAATAVWSGFVVRANGFP